MKKKEPNKIIQLTELPSREDLQDDSLYMDDDGSVYLAGCDDAIGEFTIEENSEHAKFLGYGDDSGITELTGDQIDQLCRLKSIWVTL